MSSTTGVVLAIGGVTIANRVIFHDQPMDWRIPAATGLAALGFSLAERGWPQGAQVIAWTALLTVLLTRTDPNVPSPTESAIDWWNKGEKPTDKPGNPAPKDSDTGGGGVEV